MIIITILSLILTSKILNFFRSKMQIGKGQWYWGCYWHPPFVNNTPQNGLANASTLWKHQHMGQKPILAALQVLSTNMTSACLVIKIGSPKLMLGKIMQLFCPPTFPACNWWRSILGLLTTRFWNATQDPLLFFEFHHIPNQSCK